MASTPAEYFDEKNEQLKASGAELGSINAVYQFHITGDDGGDWVIELTPDKQEVRPGVQADAACIITMKANDFMDMINGSLNSQMAFLMGKLQVKGEMALALKLQAVLG